MGGSTHPRNSIREYLGLRRDLGLMLAAIVLTNAGEEMWLRFVPKYLELMGAAPLFIALYDGLKTALAALYAWPGGVAADRWGHRRAFLFFSLLSIAGYGLLLVIPHWSGVFVAMILFLAWSNLSLPAMFSLVAVGLPSTKLVMGIGVQSMVKRFPIIVGPMIGGTLLDAYGIEHGFRYGVAVSIACGLASFALESRIEGAPPIPSDPRQDFPSTVRAFDPQLRRLLLSDILIRLCERIPAAWIVIYAMDSVHASATDVGLLTSVEMVTAMLCYLPVAHWADRSRKEPFVIATFGFFTLFPLSLLFARSLPMLYLAFVIRGLKEFGDPARKALIVSLAPPEARGRVVGAYYLIRDLTVSTGAIVGGIAWTYGPAVNFWTAAAAGVAGTLLYWMTSRRVA